MAKVPPSTRQNAPPADDTAADANNEAMKDPKSLTGKRSSENDPSTYMNITVKREKLDAADQLKQLKRECEYMIIDGKPENLYDSEEIIEIENSDKETMDVETERRMMAKYHKQKETAIKLMGTHWYLKDGKGGVNPTALVSPEAIYVKKFWETERKKRNKKASSLTTSDSNLKTKTPKVTPTKTNNKGKKKVDFAPLSSIRTRSKSKSPTNRKVTTLDAEEWPTLEEAEASPKTKKTPSPPTQVMNKDRDSSPTKEDPITIDRRAKPTESNKATDKPSSTTEIDRSKSILEQVKPTTKFQSFKQDRTQTYLDASNKEYKKVTKKETRRLNIAFDVEIKIAGPEDGARQEQALRTAITELLKEAQNVDSTFGIMAWRDTKALPTIFSAVGIQKEPYNVLINYLRPPMRGRTLQSIQTGRNFKWRIKATFDMNQETLIKTWSRMDSRRFFVTDFPVQAENCWQVGFCMGSTEGQVVTKINTELETVTGIQGIRASWQNIWQ